MANSLGLEAGSVELLPYSSKWAEIFETEADGLKSVLSNFSVAIEHVGSTAVPGMVAKPIIDIAVSTDLDSSYLGIRKALEIADYVYLLDAGNNGGHIFYKEIQPKIRSFHLHLIDRQDSQWRNYLAFRDRLRHDVDKRNQYMDVKNELASAYPHDRDSYTEGKADFISRTIREI